MDHLGRERRLLSELTRTQREVESLRAQLAAAEDRGKVAREHAQELMSQVLKQQRDKEAELICGLEQLRHALKPLDSHAAAPSGLDGFSHVQWLLESCRLSAEGQQGLSAQRAKEMYQIREVVLGYFLSELNQDLQHRAPDPEGVPREERIKDLEALCRDAAMGRNAPELQGLDEALPASNVDLYRYVLSTTKELHEAAKRKSTGCLAEELRMQKEAVTKVIARSLQTKASHYQKYDALLLLAPHFASWHNFAAAEKLRRQWSLVLEEPLSDEISPVQLQHCAQEAVRAVKAAARVSLEQLGKELLGLFICPVTMRVFQDPQLGPDGHTYEADAIQEWLATHPTSPMTRHPMCSQLLRPNRLVREAVAIISEHVGEAMPDAIDALPAHIARPDPALEVQEAKKVLCEAVLEYQEELALELLGRQLPVQAINARIDISWMNGSLLHIAIIGRMPDVASAIIGRLDFFGLLHFTNTGFTALHLAAFYGYRSLCEQIFAIVGESHSCHATPCGSWLPAEWTEDGWWQNPKGSSLADMARAGGHDALAVYLEEVEGRWRIHCRFQDPEEAMRPESGAGQSQ